MAELTRTVTSQDTAAALGSGDTEVLGTPAMLAWMEQASRSELAASLSPEQTSVGTRVELEHLAAVTVGARVLVRADLAHTDGRLHRFVAAAQDDAGRLLATATLTRVVVDRERFLSRIS